MLENLFSKDISVPSSWKYLGGGASRLAWLLPSGNVIKYPRNKWGIADNQLEATIWKDRFDPEKVRAHYIANDLWCESNHEWHQVVSEFKFARCRLIPNTYLLVMEYVACWNARGELRDDLPRWARHMDGAQVGYNRNGELVAYDYAE